MRPHRRLRPRRAGLIGLVGLSLVGAALGAAPGARAAAPTIIVDPLIERDGPDVLAVLSATSADGAQVEQGAVALEIGTRSFTPSEVTPADPTFVALGVVFVRPKDPRPDAEPSTTEADFVYKGVRAALKGSEAAFAYLTPFGLGHPEAPLRGSAGDIVSPEVANSVQYPETIDVLDAVTSNLQGLAPAPDRVKILLIVTRGGDVSAPEDPRFARIARTVADAKIKVILVSFPAREPVDADRRFIAALARATGAVHLEATRANVADVLASLSAPRGLLAFRRFRFAVASAGPPFGGDLPVRVTVQADSGAGSAAELGMLTFPPRTGLLVAVALPLAALALIIPLVRGSRRRHRWWRFLDEVQDVLHDEATEAEVQDRLGHGFGAERARFVALREGDLARELERLPPARFRRLRLPTNAKRLGALRMMLAGRGASTGGRAGVPRTNRVAQPVGTDGQATLALVRDLLRRLAPEALDVEVRGAIPKAEIAWLVQRTPSELREWLRRESEKDPDLAAPGAERYLLRIHETLVEQEQPATVAWLVGRGGAGLVGRTIPLATTNVVGWAPGASVALPRSAGISERHAMITREADGYVIRPGSGPVVLDGRSIAEPEELRDGVTVSFGPAAFVFMLARA